MTTCTPLPSRRVQVDRQGADQGLAFAGLHLGDFALVQEGAADQLHVVVAHAELAAGHLADVGEGAGVHRVEAVAGLELVLQLLGLGPQLIVGQPLEGWLEQVISAIERLQALDLALVLGAEDLGQNRREHGISCEAAEAAELFRMFDPVALFAVPVFGSVEDGRG